ncbi:MAG: sulfatase-like hydrolase/transferase [Bacilli bacterium]|nr:sulfatase-like hydrolase/transferase [Bacilli bacterium]
MKKIYNNKVVFYSCLLTIGIFILEIFFKVIMGLSVFNWSVLRIFLGCIILSNIISLLISFLKRKYANIIVCVLLFLLGILFTAQGGMRNYLGTYMSLGTASQAHAIEYFIGDFFTSLNPWFYMLFIIPILYVLYFIFLDKKFIDKSLKYKYNVVRCITVFVTIITCGLYYGTINFSFMQDKMQIVSNKELYKNPSMQNIAVSQYGLLGYEFLDIKSLVIKHEQTAETFAKYEPKEVTNYSRTIDDTAWDALQETETNKDYKTLNSYFMSKEITSKNDYTGMFKGKNLIVLMIESGSNVLKNYPEYFPNFAKLYNNGWSWENAFSPRNSCSTGNNEMTGITSLYTINNTCTINTYKDNTYYESLFNLFNRANYHTSSYHDYTDHFYYRSIYHPNMGSQNYYDVNKLGIKLGSEYQPWPSDVELIEKAVPHFINEDKYMAWLTTVSSHMTYKNSSKTGDMYLDLYKDEDWDMTAKRYMSKLKIVDNAIGELLQKLEDNGKLEDTVIMLFADHYPYGLSNEAFAQIAKYDTSSNGDTDRTPFIIYNPSLEAKKFDDYTTFVNILPTLANLFALDYDPRLYGGTDLLSDSYEGIVVFADGSWRTDKAYYDATKSKINYIGADKYTDEEIISINTKVKNEMKMDNLAIKTNYFVYLENGLKSSEDDINSNDTTTDNN